MLKRGFVTVKNYCRVKRRIGRALADMRVDRAILEGETMKTFAEQY